jgi:predicted ATPase
VGLNSGEVVVRAIGNDLHMDYSAVGQTTHLAARMEQLATPGSIRLTAVTLRLAEGLVQVNALGPFPVKGLTEPVEVFELVGASAIRRRLQASVARGLTRFVGRQQELLALQQALEQAGACHGQIVAVVGEVGVGKSRLVYEFIHSHHTQGWSVIESASVSYGKATPYFPVIDLLKRYSHIEDHDDTRAIRAKLTGQVLTLDTALQEVIPVLLALLDAAPEDSPFLTLDPGQRRQHTLDALKRLLLRESQVQPLLLVFEDLHWIDSETQALLNSLVESLPTTQLLLLVNYRPEYQHGWGSKTYYTQLRLDPLPPVNADEFLYALLGNDPSLAPVTRLLIARTEGNPFFLEESVRTLIETGVLVGEPGAYRLAQALPTIQIPTSVQAVLAARIDRLSADEKRLLQAAAVIGTEVRVPLLEAIAEIPEATLYRGLAHLQAAEFLYETRLFPERAYTFKHALTQQVAYQSLLMRTRQRYHQQLAQVLAAQPETVETQPELLAHHYTEAGLAAPAVTYWQRAGQRASERSAHLEAISHFTRGLEILQTLPDTAERAQHELHLQTALASVCIAVKGMGAVEVEQAYTRAHMLCQQVGDTSQLLLVLQGLRRFYTGRNDHQRVREIGEQLLHLGQRLHDPAVLLEAHLALGLLMRHLGELVAAHGHLEQALALYDRQAHHTLALRHGRDPGVSSRNFLILTLWLLGYPDQALQRSHEAITLAQDLAHPYSLVLALSFAARHAHLLRREARATQELAEAAIALCTTQGFAQWLAENTLVCGWALAVQGQGEAGIAQLRQALAAFEATGASVRPYQLAMLAEAYGTTGQAEAGLVTLAEAFAAMHTTGERVWEAQLHQLKGELLLQAGGQACEAAAAACLHHALDVARRQQAKAWELRAATSLSRLWQQQGKQAEACTLLAPIYGWFTEGFDTADLQEAKALLEALV